VCCGHALLIETQGDTRGRVDGSEWRNRHLNGDFERLSGHLRRAVPKEGSDAICAVQSGSCKEALDPVEEPGIVLYGFREGLDQIDFY
jgi:hypothetical protein